MTKNEVILALFDTIILGYTITVIFVLALILFKSRNLKKFSSRFLDHSILIIRLVAIAYVIYYIVSLSIYFSSEEATVFSLRAKGSYAWAYWFMIIRPFIFCGLTQLFWIKKFKKSMVWIAILTILILLFTLLSGTNLERFIIFVTSFHRDFSNNNEEFRISIFSLILSCFLFIIKSAILFSSLVFAYWYISEKIEKK